MSDMAKIAATLRSQEVREALVPLIRAWMEDGEVMAQAELSRRRLSRRNSKSRTLSASAREMAAGARQSGKHIGLRRLLGCSDDSTSLIRASSDSGAYAACPPQYGPSSPPTDEPTPG